MVERMAKTTLEQRTRTGQDDDLERLYNAVAAAADESYDVIADELERFFQNRNQAAPAMQEGRIDVHADHNVTVRLMGEEYISGTTPRTVPHRYVPLDRPDMMDLIKNVYGPLEASRTQIDTARQEDRYAEIDAFDDLVERLSGDVTAEDADAVFVAVRDAYGEEPVESRRTVYRAE